MSGRPVCGHGGHAFQAPTHLRSHQSSSGLRTAAGNAPPPGSFPHRPSWPLLNPDLSQKNTTSEILHTSYMHYRFVSGDQIMPLSSRGILSEGNCTETHTCSYFYISENTGLKSSSDTLWRGIISHNHRGWLCKKTCCCNVIGVQKRCNRASIYSV